MDPLSHSLLLRKKLLLFIWLIMLGAGIAALFWYNGWQYSLPTPIPRGYQPVVHGQAIKLTQPGLKASDKPLFIHFYNPECPCSRFNMPVFKALVKAYGHQVNFVIVVMSDEAYTVQEIHKKFDLNLPVYFDQAIAKTCGVYSTPQAVLIDRHNMLYYRGNYNTSRYCTDERTSFARIAITGLLNNNKQIAFNPLALRAYGCSLPGCTGN